MTVSGITRREFIKLFTKGALALGGLLGLGGLVRFLSYQPEPPPAQKIEIGPAKDYALDSRTILPAIPALLIRSKDGFHALSLVCTHLGCTVQDQAGLFTCPCHGSHFDANGKVTRRPANSPLRDLHVEVTSDGNLVVYL